MPQNTLTHLPQLEEQFPIKSRLYIENQGKVATTFEIGSDLFGIGHFF
jgi:hypothetical protein